MEHEIRQPSKLELLYLLLCVERLVVVSRVRCSRAGMPVVTERLIPEGCWFRLVLDT